MPDPTYIRLPADGSGKYVRSVEITQVDATGTALTLEQEAVVLADEHGNLFRLKDGRQAAVLDSYTHRLLRGICLRLDVIAAALDKNYGPPDEIGDDD